jgi:hypothetical protein
LLRAISEGQFDSPRTLRADLPAGLEAIVLRAMHLAPKARFESIHALGQKLWEFASPRGQAQWKTFYFHTPEAARPAPEDRPTVERPRAGSTASLERATAPALTGPQASTIGPSSFAVTKTAVAAAVGEATSASHSDIAGESAASQAPDTASRKRARRLERWRVVLALACVAGIGVVIQRASHTSPAPGPSPGVAALPATTAPSNPRSAPRPTVPAEAVMNPTASSAPVAPTSQDPVLAPARKADPVPEMRPKRRAPRRPKAANVDQHGIGIPTE